MVLVIWEELRGDHKESVLVEVEHGSKREMHKGRSSKNS